jgi:hypothetical protein
VVGGITPLSAIRPYRSECHQEGLGHIWKPAPNLWLFN